MGKGGVGREEWEGVTKLLKKNEDQWKITKSVSGI